MMLTITTTVFIFFYLKFYTRHSFCSLWLNVPVLCPVHAAVITINETVERGCVEETAQALRNPNAMLSNLQEPLMAIYQEMLRQARTHKAAQASAKVRDSELSF